MGAKHDRKRFALMPKSPKQLKDSPVRREKPKGEPIPTRSGQDKITAKALRQSHFRALEGRWDNKVKS